MRYAIVHTRYGFLPRQRKRAYLVVLGPDATPADGTVVLDRVPERFAVYAVETRVVTTVPRVAECPIVAEGPVVARDGEDPLGVVAVIDFSSVRHPGLYQLHVAGRDAGDRRLHPFFIRSDLYSLHRLRGVLLLARTAVRRPRRGRAPGVSPRRRVDAGRVAPIGARRMARRRRRAQMGRSHLVAGDWSVSAGPVARRSLATLPPPPIGLRVGRAR